MKKFCSIIISLVIAASLGYDAAACTSMIVSARASATGRPILWKHRDTGNENNFVERVAARDGRHGYVALYNAGDSTLSEAWQGMNDAGFAIMNTASYNLAPDTAKYKDMEGVVMALALQRCTTVDDFAALLDTLPKPMGVQANFGVIDASGNAAYFETDDYKYTKFDVADTEEGLIVRTNYSVSGNDTDGYGYIRYQNALDLIKQAPGGKISPEYLTEEISRKFYHSMWGRDMAADNSAWLVDQDFIPRRISTASVAVEGINPGEDVADMVMWTVLGYPPCSPVTKVTLDSVPDELRPTAPRWRAPLCNEVVARKHRAFPIQRGSGSHYIDMNYLRPIMAEMHRRSVEVYSQGRCK